MIQTCWMIPFSVHVHQLRLMSPQKTRRSAQFVVRKVIGKFYCHNSIEPYRHTKYKVKNVISFMHFTLLIATDGKHHLHYGGICCYSCRAFFRRAHQSTKNPSFKCRKKRNGSNSSATSSQQDDIRCVIDGSARRQCQLCRYKRCLEIGKYHHQIWLA